MSAVSGLPPITGTGVALGIFAVLLGWALSFAIRRLVSSMVRWRGRGESSSAVFGRLAGWATLVVGIAVGLTITFPSVRPVDLLGGIGVVSIAAGIAFQTVLGNMFAGIVILTRDTFRVGDQILVQDYQGTVTSMGLTSTTVRTFEGRLVLIPNGVLHSEVVTVQTGYEQVRTTVAVDIDDTADLARARAVAVKAMTALPAVLDEPAPDALLSEIGTATVRLELRFWSGARQLETRGARHAVICAVLGAFATNGIATGSDVTVIEPGPRLTGLVEERMPPGET